MTMSHKLFITLFATVFAFNRAGAQIRRPGIPDRPGFSISRSRPTSASSSAAAQAERPPLPKRIGTHLPPAMKPQGKAAKDFEKLIVRKGMVRISAGKNEGENLDEDLQSYSLQITEPFHMDQTEVTWKLWKEVKEWAITRPDLPEADRAFFKYDLDHAGVGQGDEYPVHSVTWLDCIKWCNARSEKEGLTPCYSVGGVVFRKSADGIPDCSFSASGYRLPTIQEWEYAARGGLVGKRFPWGDEITHDDANYFSTDGSDYNKSKTMGLHPKFKKTDGPALAPVKSFAPNGYGLYDMAGNVWEWCWAPKGSSRFVCGGSWDADPMGLRCGSRSACDGPHDRGDFGGFRTVRRAGQ